MSKVSMLPISMVDDAEGGVHYGDWKHTNFCRWTRSSPNKCFSITNKDQYPHLYIFLRHPVVLSGLLTVESRARATT